MPTTTNADPTTTKLPACLALLPERIRRRITTDGDCWLWAGKRSVAHEGGYARVWLHGRMVPLHRVVFTNAYGEIPAGLTLDHLCRVRHCVNPRHLEPTTNRENILRGEGAAAKNARKTLCDRGHDLGNARFTKDGERHCRLCNRDRMRAKRGFPLPRKTNCPKGHSYAEHARQDNGGRHCRVCQSDAKRARKATL